MIDNAQIKFFAERQVFFYDDIVVKAVAGDNRPRHASFRLLLGYGGMNCAPYHSGIVGVINRVCGIREFSGTVLLYPVGHVIVFCGRRPLAE